MGKIADRLARKSDPLYDQAKAIVRQASAFEQDFDDDEFDRLKERLDSALGSLTRSVPMMPKTRKTMDSVRKTGWKLTTPLILFAAISALDTGVKITVENANAETAMPDASPLRCGSHFCRQLMPAP